jgi:ribose 5-phosphate isomerase A
VDGLDEMDNNMNIVKGRGAALNWEKQLALRSKRRIYIGDHTKYNGRGYLYLKPVPVEVSPPSLHYTLALLGKHGRVRLRTGSGKDGPVITDSGNYIVDLYTDMITDPVRLDAEIRGINGVVETGLFPNSLVDTVIIAYPDGRVRVFEK